MLTRKIFVFIWVLSDNILLKLHQDLVAIVFLIPLRRDRVVRRWIGISRNMFQSTLCFYPLTFSEFICHLS